LNEQMSKAKLLDSMSRTYAEWDALLGAIGEQRMQQPGAAGQWTVKDVIAELSKGDPPIEVNPDSHDELILAVFTLKPGEDKVVRIGVQGFAQS